MNKIIDYFKNLSLLNKIIIIVGLLLFILIIAYGTLTGQPSNILTTGLLPKPTTTPSPAPTTIVTFPSPTTIPFPTPQTSITLKLTGPVETKNKLNVFSNATPLTSSETLSTLPNNFGFGIGDRSTNSGDNLMVWAKGDNTLAVLIKENSIIFSSLATPSASGNILSINDSYSVGRQFISKLFGKEVEATLINQNVVYYRTSRIYASPSAADKADLVRVSFYQSINNYPVVSISETGAIFTLYIDRALNLHSMSVIGGYRTISQGIEVNITPFSDAEKNFDLALRINTSPDLGSNFKTASNTELNLTTTKVQLAYMLIGNTFSPVYLLSGSLRGTTAPIQEGLYVIPAAQSN